jgi:hypothetical protein
MRVNVHYIYSLYYLPIFMWEYTYMMCVLFLCTNMNTNKQHDHDNDDATNCDGRAKRERRNKAQRRKRTRRKEKTNEGEIATWTLYSHIVWSLISKIEGHYSVYMYTCIEGGEGNEDILTPQCSFALFIARRCFSSSLYFI